MCTRRRAQVGIRRGRREVTKGPPGHVCSFDLHALLPVPAPILALGPGDPTALSWLREHRGTEDGVREVVLRPDATAGRRLSAGQAVIGYGFFTNGAALEAAVTRLAARWPGLRFTLRPRPPD